jgi:tetratricopeptide (TPR) repeat protein
LAGAGALLALVLACYWPSLSGGFLWDDDVHVVENPTLRDERGLTLIWTQPRVNQQYYPLTHTSFWLEQRLWSLWATGYRITNLMLHASIVLMLWTALRRLEVAGAWVAAAAFAVHPVHVETVAWITERKNLLSGALYAGALLAYLRFAGLDGVPAPVGRRRTRAYALALGLFAAALLSKTAVVTLPVALLLVAWWKRGRLQGADLWGIAPMLAVGLVLGATTWSIERHHVGAWGAGWEQGPLERVLIAGRAVWFYAAKLVWPFGLSFIYPRWPIDAGSPGQWLFPVSALALPLVLWLLRQRLGRGALVGVAFFELSLAPGLGFVDFYFQLYSYVQDHFQYVASIGLIALLTAGAVSALRRLPAWAGPAVAAPVLALLVGLSLRHAEHFRSEEALWTSVLRRNPGAWMAELNLGRVYQNQDRLEEASACYARALAVPHSLQHKVHYNLGLVREQQGRLTDAIDHYERAIALEPHHADRGRFLAQAHNNLGIVLVRLGRPDEARGHFHTAIELEPTAHLAHFNLAARLAEIGASAEAEEHYRTAVRLKPDYVEAHWALGVLLASQGRHEEAVAAYVRAAADAPSAPALHYNLGFSLEAMGDLRRAEMAYRSSIQLDPDFAEPHNNLAILLFSTERPEEAQREIERYQALGGVPDPSFLDALADALGP